MPLVRFYFGYSIWRSPWLSGFFTKDETSDEEGGVEAEGGMFGWFKKLTGDSKIEELKRQFAQIDKDGGGTVDREEIV